MKLDKNTLFGLLQNPVMWKSRDILANCPWCGHREFYVSINDNHPFNCVRKKKCGESGSIYKLLDKLGKRDLYNLKESIKWTNSVPETLELIKNDEIDIDLKEIKQPIGFRRIYASDYLKNRGFSDEDFNNYVIGETKLDGKLINYIIFAIYNDSKFVATIGRYKGSKEEIDLLEKKLNRKIPRYRNSDGDFDKIVGNYDDIETGITKTVILVEGLFDSKNVSDLLNLKNNKEVKCCFTFKCHISDEQIYKLQLKGIENIILIYDPDVIDKIRDEGVNLNRFFNVKIGLIEAKNENGSLKDPGDLKYEELVSVMDNLYNPLSFYTAKVQILDL